MNKFEYRITEKVYDWMKNGTKKIEVRLFNEKAKRINIGDEITFISLETNKTVKVKVTGLLRYANILDLFEDFSTSLVSDKIMTKEEIVTGLEEIFGKEEVSKHDVLGIKFELINEI